jgi:hypothetical protein
VNTSFGSLRAFCPIRNLFFSGLRGRFRAYTLHLVSSHTFLQCVSMLAGS